MSSVDWTRVAKPQPDSYDLEIVLAGAKKQKAWHWHRIPSSHYICNDRIALVNSPHRRASHLQNAPFDHPLIRQIEQSLKTWPDGYQALIHHCNSFNPLDYDPPLPTPARGSCSGHDWDSEEPMSLYATVFDLIGSTEAIYHELGHVRLHCLGIHLETHDGSLIGNSETERYVSPVRRDILRPMSAVFHAQYSWVMLTEADLHLVPSHGKEVTRYLADNVPKLENGLKELKTHLRYANEDAAVFFSSFYQWCEEVIARGHKILSDYGVLPIPDDRPIPTY